MVTIKKHYEDTNPTEEDLRALLEKEGAKVNSWSADAGTTNEPEGAAHKRSVVVLRGMVRITLPGHPDEFADLMAGDRIDIPKGTLHGMMVGPAGVSVVEGN